jgi:predicted pyridoxine 5'-phosphate oxidase superfamily flavin-nucleotide-binding protein
MSYGFLDIAVTPAVREAQAAMGVDGHWDGFKGHREFDRFGDNEAAFIAARDSFYMATVSETGWPYVQHRGGPRGFLKMVDNRTLAFADYRGNRQYISTGNLAASDRASIFLMDYAGRARLKIYAHIETVALDADPALTEQRHRLRRRRCLARQTYRPIHEPQTLRVPRPHAQQLARGS